MSETKDRPLLTARAKAFPSPAEIAAWAALSDAEKIAALDALEAEAVKSGRAPAETAEELIARVRASR
jgi:predicted Fe-S protein YdhL (DUF1289 family)